MNFGGVRKFYNLYASVLFFFSNFPLTIVSFSLSFFLILFFALFLVSFALIAGSAEPHSAAALLPVFLFSASSSLGPDGLIFVPFSLLPRSFGPEMPARLPFLAFSQRLETPLFLTPIGYRWLWFFQGLRSNC